MTKPNTLKWTDTPLRRRLRIAVLSFHFKVRRPVGRHFHQNCYSKTFTRVLSKLSIGDLTAHLEGEC